VHVLGYFLDEEDATLQAFLATQRQDRRRRLAEMADRLASAGAPVAIDALLAQPASSGRAVGRPQLAALLIEAGHARDVADAFDRFLAPGRPGFTSRRGAAPVEVVQLIAAAGGLASLAHPVKLPDQSLIGEMIAAGLPAIEVFHPDHDDEARRRYAALAGEHGLLVTGGSDYHGSNAGRENQLGRVGLPDGEFARLIAARPARDSR
jgi:predicted metal-dependent phosphoesterase TrpH